VLTIAGLLVAEGKQVEPVLVLRASDPAAARALASYINEAVDRDAEDTVIQHAKATLLSFQQWARDFGTFKQLEAPYHKDYVGGSEPTETDKPQPKKPADPAPTQTKPTPGKGKRK
jgi:hypothetical protein